MKQEYKNEIEIELEKDLKRPIENHELINLENDALLLARFLMTKVEQLENRIILLEKGKII